MSYEPGAYVRECDVPNEHGAEDLLALCPVSIERAATVQGPVQQR